MQYHHMVSKIVWSSFFFLILFSSCAHEDTANEATDAEPAFDFVLMDSVVIDRPKSINFHASYPEKQLLLFSVEDGEVILTNFSGNILYSFSPLSPNEGQMGKTLCALGFYDDSTLIATSERGYFLYSFDGILTHSVKDPSKYVVPVIPEIYRFRDKQKDMVFSILKGFFDPQKEVLMNGTEEYFERFRLLTAKDLSKDGYELAIGFEEDGLFRQEPRAYLNIFPTMAYSPDLAELSVTFNPDLHIYVYDVKQNFSLKRKLPISAIHYNQAVAPSKHMAQGDLYQTLLMNGQVASLDVWGRRHLVVYSSGVSEEDYDGSLAGNLQGLSELDARFNKRYAMLFEDGKKVGGDVPIPPRMASAATFLSKDEVLFIANSNLMEREDRTVFYRYRIAEKNYD